MEKRASEDLGRLPCPRYRAWTPRGSGVRATPTYLEVSVGEGPRNTKDRTGKGQVQAAMSQANQPAHPLGSR